jgi:hypothetical protein
MKAIELTFNGSTTIHSNMFDEYDDSKTYHIIFYEKKNDEWLESMNPIVFKPGTYYSFFRRFFNEVKAELIGFDELEGVKVIDEVCYNPEGKNIKIQLDTNDKHEAFVWIEQAQEFGKKWNCNIYISCEEDILKEATRIYKSNFIRKSDGGNFYATYHIGRYNIQDSLNLFGMQHQNKGWITNNSWQRFKSFNNPRDWNFLHSEQIARDILGLSDNQGFRQRYTDTDWFTNINQNNK